MTVTADNQLISPEPQQDFKLQPAAIDWRTNKTQVTTGAALAAVVAAGAHFTGVLNWSLTLTLFNAALVALITTEITGRYGNRLGGAASVWAAILFAITQPAITTAKLTPAAAILPLYLISLFGYLRYRSTRQKLFLRGALLSALLGYFTSVVSITIPVVILAAEVILPLSPESVVPRSPAAALKQTHANRWIAVMLFFLALTFAGTAGLLAPNMVPMLNPPQLPAFDDANMHALLAPQSQLALTGHIGAVLCGLAGGSARVVVFFLIWMLAVSTNLTVLQVPVAILLATLALPVTKAVPKQTATIITIVGLLTLTLCAFGRL